METKLPERVKKYGFEHRRVAENKLGYVYGVFSDEGSCGFDVFRKKSYKESQRVINGLKVTFGGKEVYPNDNAFGTWAWHCMTIEQAKKRLGRL